MNRRLFLKSLLVGAVAAQVDLESSIQNIILETEYLSDSEFVTYMTYQVQMYVHNPSMCAIIDNIVGEP